MQSPSFFTTGQKIQLFFRLNWKYEIKDIINAMGFPIAYVYIGVELADLFNFVGFIIVWTVIVTIASWFLISEKRLRWKDMERFRVRYN